MDQRGHIMDLVHMAHGHQVQIIVLRRILEHLDVIRQGIVMLLGKH